MGTTVCCDGQLAWVVREYRPALGGLDNPAAGSPVRLARTRGPFDYNNRSQKVSNVPPMGTSQDCNIPGGSVRIGTAPLSQHCDILRPAWQGRVAHALVMPHWRMALPLCPCALRPSSCRTHPFVLCPRAASCDIRIAAAVERITSSAGCFARPSVEILC
jgi:hypothetical protein